MSETRPLEERVQAARTHVRPVWDEARALHLAERAMARRRRRVIARSAALALAAVAVLGFFYRSQSPSVIEPSVHETVPTIATAGPTGILRFPDGSVVTPLDPTTDVAVDAVREGAIELELVTGAARFQVTPGLPRAFRVQAGRATVSVVGTVFTVRREGDGASVEVEEGRVHVSWDGGHDAYVAAGERGVFPRADDAVSALVPPPVREAPIVEDVTAPAVITPAVREHERPRPRVEAVEPSEPAVEPTAVAPARTVPEWRSLADQGHFDEGYALLLADRDVLRSDDVDALMAAADCARLSEHPAESLAYLRRAEEVGRSDPRAPMIAFTLGRVLLSQLASPREAAAEFAHARSLSPTGTLASDALAREVEAWSRAGEPARARERAEEYVRLYPDGLHGGAVRRFGGLTE